STIAVDQEIIDVSAAVVKAYDYLAGLVRPDGGFEIIRRRGRALDIIIDADRILPTRAAAGRVRKDDVGETIQPSRRQAVGCGGGRVAPCYVDETGVFGALADRDTGRLELMNKRLKVCAVADRSHRSYLDRCRKRSAFGGGTRDLDF